MAIFSYPRLTRILRIVFELLIAIVFLSGCQSPSIVTVSEKPVPPPIPDYREKDTGLVFPAQILEMAVTSINDYELESPGLGKGISYRDPANKLEFYIYDLQAAIIPNGVNNEAIQSAYQTALIDVQATAKSGFYHNFSFENAREIELGGHPFLYSRFAYNEELIAKESHLLITGFNTQIVKIRLTLSEKDFSIKDLSLTNNPFTSEKKQAFQQIANIIADARSRGFTGVSTEEIHELQSNLQSVNIDDGITELEAITIAQVELINKGFANEWNIMQPEEILPSPIAAYQTSFPLRDLDTEFKSIKVWIDDAGTVTIEQKGHELQF